MDSETLDRAAQTIYERIAASVCASPTAPPGFLPVPWAHLPDTLKQDWRDAVTAGFAAISQGQS